MNTQEIQAEKLSLINWISQLQDISLIGKLKEIQEDNYEIQQWQKEIVRESIENAKPEDFIPKQEIVKRASVAEKQLEEGNYKTHSEVRERLDKWIK